MSYYVEPFTFDFEISKIVVDDNIYVVDCFLLYDAIKLAQASEEGIIYERIGTGSGLKELGPGVQIGLTVELLGTWQLKFKEGNYIARIGGGNLVGGPAGDPVAYSAGVQTLLIQSAASTVVDSNNTNSCPTVEDIADEVMSRLGLQPISVNLTQPANTNLSNAVRNNLIDANINVNIKYVNGVPIKGTGQAGNEWGPA